jgi:hypothetical protein
MSGSDFRHVSNTLLRHILQQQPHHLKRSDLQQALGFTLDALGRDAINQDVQEDAFEARRDAAREADKALARHRNARALRSIQRFWLT